jgi:molybdopterin synthase catalytic subunit
MIRVQREDFDIGAEIAKLTAANRQIGGVASFVKWRAARRSAR